MFLSVSIWDSNRMPYEGVQKVWEKMELKDHAVFYEFGEASSCKGSEICPLEKNANFKFIITIIPLHMMFGMRKIHWQMH